MQSDAPSVSDSKVMLWAGWVISVLPAAMLVMSGVVKLIRPPFLSEGLAHLGWPESVVLALGICELGSTLLYLIPQTAVLGAILVTGYLGGAIATHVRIGEGFLIPVLLGIAVWLGLFLRDCADPRAAPIPQIKLDANHSQEFPMKTKMTSMMLAVILGFGAAVVSFAFADTDESEMQLPPGWTAEDMQAIMAAGTPGKMHQHLAQDAGKWRGKTTMWMFAGAEPTTSQCSFTILPMMDGRFFKIEMAGEMPAWEPSTAWESPASTMSRKSSSPPGSTTKAPALPTAPASFPPTAKRSPGTSLTIARSRRSPS